MTGPPIRYEELAPTLPDGPIDLNLLVPGAGPLELDLGFGRGRSFIERLQKSPESRVIGLEIKAKLATKVEERRLRLALARGRAYRAEARELLGRAGPAGCLARAFVHFPDPWWKKRHAKRRVLSDSLLDRFAELLEVGGQLFIQTDVEERADAYVALLETHPAFEPVEATYRVADNPFGARSNREVRAEQDGLPIHRILARRGLASS